MGILVAEAWIQRGAVTYIDYGFAYIWQQPRFYYRSPFLESWFRNLLVAQPIDWCIKSQQIEAKDKGQIKTRGLYARMLSHGAADTPLVSSVWGLFNALVASDFKDWCSQIVDHSGNIQAINSATSIRTRMTDSSGNLADRTFGNVATWGNHADGDAGNYLICDEEVNTIALSDAVRGEHVSWMPFGHKRNRAESLEFASIAADIRSVGGRRRRGR
jgi:hypothetical protein